MAARWCCFPWHACHTRGQRAVAVAEVQLRRAQDAASEPLANVSRSVQSAFCHNWSRGYSPTVCSQCGGPFSSLSQFGRGWSDCGTGLIVPRHPRTERGRLRSALAGSTQTTRTDVLARLPSAPIRMRKGARRVNNSREGKVVKAAEQVFIGILAALFQDKSG